MSRLWICGEALIDFVPDTTQAGARAYVPKPGGSPFNAAKAAARLGAEAAFIGAVSQDFFGDMLRDDLLAAGVDCRLLQTRAEPTTLAFVDLVAGEARYAFYNEATANARMDPAAPPVRPGDIVDVGSIALIPDPAADRIAAMALAAAETALLSVDPNVRPGLIGDRAAWQARMDRLLAAAAVVKLSTEDLAAMEPAATADGFAERMLAGGAGLVVVTDGANGVTGYTAHRRHHAPAPQVEVADTVGAGDVVTGAVLSRLAGLGVRDVAGLAALEPATLADIMAFAVAAAALTCQAQGCVTPTAEKVAAFRRGG